MAIITEDYVSFETAKLLKKKGFKGEGEHFYENNKIVAYVNYWDRITPKQRYEAIEAPTLQMTMKWLRKIYKIDIAIYPYGEYSSENYQFDVYENRYLMVSKDDGYMTYEQACEAAIKYCLENLI